MCVKNVLNFGSGLAHNFIDIFNKLVDKGAARFQADAPDQIDINDGSLVFVNGGTSRSQVDDLTVIKGIGPTFAARLENAGVTTYKSLAKLTPDELKEITHVADWQGNPGDWINQAKSYENSH